MHMVCVSGTAVLLEATGGTAVVYVGDNKLSGSSASESRPCSTARSWARGESSDVGSLRPDQEFYYVLCSSCDLIFRSWKKRTMKHGVFY